MTAARIVAGAVLAVTALAAAAAAADPGVPLRARVTLKPGIAKLGERVVYVGRVVHPGAASVKWLAPEPDPAFHWGSPTRGLTRARARTDPDTAWIEIPLQVFDLGRVTIAGLRFEIGGADAPRLHRLPLAKLAVVPVLAANDSNASLRPLRGPLAAPWWERVAWRWVFGVLVALAALLAVALSLRRRRGAKVPPAVTPALDPAAEALAALEELRRLDLPQQGRFAEHAFRLGQILRRYLEATVRTPRPGDSTTELVARLREAAIGAPDLQRLSGLLRGWDRIKFARDPCDVQEASHSERLVVDFVRRPARRLEEVA